ncbi:hypothetical protein [Myroides guanonis]|uniref:Uncharacterized protein n=1 Tax=Myroides guanonis TaxID=1150112 RepID=A0A1I3PGK2_9FLAO|nr:hypothetical protein [Myroides guanonis]SFJ20409.1 hypothetical protein SAMN04487893_104112 [Myroides guanonis]
MKYISLIVLTSLFIQCKGNILKLREDNNEYKNEYLAKFDSEFINHFPNELGTSRYTLLSSENTKRGFVGLLLYEYDMNIDSLIGIEKGLKSKAVRKYDSSDNCLLVINRFDTNETYVYPKLIILPDSVEVNRPCFEGLLPIPKFFNYENEVSNPSQKALNNKQDYETMLPAGFNIYVLEAKSGNYFDKYDLIPNRQMPNGWKNGYSKGVAISLNDKSIAYWSIAF